MLKRALTSCFILAWLVVSVGCEKGWSLEAQLELADGANPGRPVTVLLFEGDDPDIDVAASDLYGLPLVDGEVMSERTMPFEHFEFGCAGDYVAFIAWAPVADDDVADGWRAPQPGDYYGATGWIEKSGCGYRGKQTLAIELAEVIE